MHDFCIDSSVIGTQQHLLCTSNGYAWVDDVPCNVWYINGNIKLRHGMCFDTLLKLNHKQIDFSPPNKFVTAMSTVMSGSTLVPWQKIMPTREHRMFLERLINELTVTIATIDKRYYSETWVPGCSVLNDLQQSRINVNRLNTHINQNIGNVHVLQTFIPDRNSYLLPPVYNRFGTLTGRMTITSGPNILTLKRNYRDIIQTSYIDGEIMVVDFSSLEPRILLYENGKTCDQQDLYEKIAVDINCGLSRDVIKGVVLADMYGRSKETLGDLIGIQGKQLDDVVGKIKRYFNTKNLLKRIKQQLVETGCIENRYGRKIIVDQPLDHHMINYYAQSTGADISLLGFSQIINELKTTAPSVKPLFLLHDALILDVPKQYISLIENIKTIKINGYVQKFYLKAKKLVCT